MFAKLNWIKCKPGIEQQLFRYIIKSLKTKQKEATFNIILQPGTVMV